MTGYAPSSPCMALFKDGQLVFMLQRTDLQQMNEQQVASALAQAFAQHGGKTGPSVDAETFRKIRPHQGCGSQIPLMGPLVRTRRSGRIGWLRARRPGRRTTGSSPTASLMMGVAASHAAPRAILIAGVAGLVAGAASMAVGRVRLRQLAARPRAGAASARAEPVRDAPERGPWASWPSHCRCAEIDPGLAPHGSDADHGRGSDRRERGA